MADSRQHSGGHYCVANVTFKEFVSFDKPVDLYGCVFLAGCSLVTADEPSEWIGCVFKGDCTVNGIPMVEFMMGVNRNG